jgi:hypothetical protein
VRILNLLIELRYAFGTPSHRCRLGYNYACRMAPGKISLFIRGIVVSSLLTLILPLLRWLLICVVLLAHLIIWSTPIDISRLPCLMCCLQLLLNPNLVHNVIVYMSRMYIIVFSNYKNQKKDLFLQIYRVKISGPWILPN